MKNFLILSSLIFSGLFNLGNLQANQFMPLPTESQSSLDLMKKYNSPLSCYREVEISTYLDSWKEKKHSFGTECFSNKNNFS